MDWDARFRCIAKSMTSNFVVLGGNLKMHMICRIVCLLFQLAGHTSNLVNLDGVVAAVKWVDDVKITKYLCRVKHFSN